MGIFYFDSLKVLVDSFIIRKNINVYNLNIFIGLKVMLKNNIKSINLYIQNLRLKIVAKINVLTYI